MTGTKAQDKDDTVAVHPPLEASQLIDVTRSQEFWCSLPGPHLCIVVGKTLMRLPPFSLERHSDVLHDLIKDAQSKGRTSGDGFSETYPIFLPSTVELRPMESFLRRVYGPGRDSEGMQVDHVTTVQDLISNLKLSRYLMSRACYFEAVTQLESIEVAKLPSQWQAWWTPLTRIAVAMACGVKKWLQLPETYTSLLTMPSVMWRSPYIADILSGPQDVQRLLLMDKQVDRLRFICAFESPFDLRCGSACSTKPKCQEAWDMAWRITFAPILVQRDFPMSLSGFAERILLTAPAKQTGLCNSCHSSMLRDVRNDLKRARSTDLTVPDDAVSYFGQE